MEGTSILYKKVFECIIQQIDRDIMIINIVNVLELKISWHQFDKLFFEKSNGSMAGSRQHQFFSYIESCMTAFVELGAQNRLMFHMYTCASAYIKIFILKILYSLKLQQS